DHGEVHPVRTGPHRAAQARRAELQIGGEGVGDLVQRRGAARLGLLEQRLERRAGRRIRIVADPGLDARAQPRLDAHTEAPASPPGAEPPPVIRRTVSASRREILGPASRPASSTSSWLSASPLMPAARLVTSEMPSRSIPARRAAIASSAVDMPTRSAPST